MGPPATQSVHSRFERPVNPKAIENANALREATNAPSIESGQRQLKHL